MIHCPSRSVIQALAGVGLSNHPHRVSRTPAAAATLGPQAAEGAAQLADQGWEAVLRSRDFPSDAAAALLLIERGVAAPPFEVVRLPAGAVLDLVQALIATRQEVEQAAGFWASQAFRERVVRLAGQVARLGLATDDLR